MNVRFRFEELIAAVVLLLSSGCRPEDPVAQSGPIQGSTPVVVSPVARENVAESLSLVGSIEANEMVEIKAEALGIVEKILFEEGQDVVAGDVLIQLNQEKLESGYGESVANLKLSQSELARTDQLFREKLISQQEYDQAATRAESDSAVAELRKRQLADTEVIAPFAGVVGGRNVSPGQVITRDETLTWLVDLDPVKLSFSVPERFLTVAKKGQTVSIEVAAFPDRTFEGEVYFVAPFVDLNTRNIEVKAAVPNSDRSLIPGMFANIELTLTVRQQALVIPEMAIFRTLENDEAIVYVVGPGNVAAMKTISIGERMPGKVEVLSGLEEDDLVIIEGTQKIGPGAPVAISGGQEAVPGA